VREIQISHPGMHSAILTLLVDRNQTVEKIERQEKRVSSLIPRRVPPLRFIHLYIHTQNVPVGTGEGTRRG